MNVILDLDQTLISAIDYKEYTKKDKKRKALFKSHDMSDHYIVFERPGLQQFLDFLFENYNVSVWTAASRLYATFIIQDIILQNKPNRKLDWIFYSYHCDISQDETKSGGTKDLSLLWKQFKLKGFNSKNTVILDDYDEVYDTQPGNCIIANPFEVTENNSEKDQYLQKLESVLKEHLHEGKSPAREVNKAMGN